LSTNLTIQIAIYINSEELYYKALWRKHLNKRRSSKKMVRNIKTKYGDNIVIIIGDLCSDEDQTDIFKWLLTILVNNFAVYKMEDQCNLFNCFIHIIHYFDMLLFK
jgi:hypothetical protein